MANFGSALGGFSSGLRAGYEVGSSVKEAYRQEKARNRLKERLTSAREHLELEENARMGEDGTVYSQMNGVPIEIKDGKGWMTNGAENTTPVRSATYKASTDVQATPAENTPAPIEDRSTPIEDFSAPIEDRSTPIRPRVAKAPESKAPTRQNIARERKKAQDAKPVIPRGTTLKPDYTGYDIPGTLASQLGLSGTYGRFAPEEAIARSRRPDPMGSTINNTLPGSRLPAPDWLKKYGTEVVSRQQTTPSALNILSGGKDIGELMANEDVLRAARMSSSKYEQTFIPEQKIADERAKASRAQALNQASPRTSALPGNVGAASSPASKEAAPATAEGNPAASVPEAQRTALPSGMSPRQADTAPAAASSTPGGAQTTALPANKAGGTNVSSGAQNTALPAGKAAASGASAPMSRTARLNNAYRAYNDEVFNAQIEYLLETNPEQGVAMARELQTQRAQWDYSDMVRGALQGDVSSLEKFLPYVRAISGQNVQLSSDGTQLLVPDVNGKLVAKPITGDMIMQAANDFYPIYMLANNMAGEKVLSMYNANRKLNIAQGALDVDAARVRARYGTPRGWKLSVSTDADGNLVIIDQNSGRVFDSEFNALLPPNYTKPQLEARLGSGSKRVDIDGRDGILSEDGNTFYDFESGQFFPMKQMDSEAVSPTEGPVEERAKANPNVAAGGASRPAAEPVEERTEAIPGVAAGRTPSSTGEPVEERTEAIPSVGAGRATSPTGESVKMKAPVKFNDASVAFLKELEGFNASPYEDYTQTSIGYGTRANPGEKSITEEEATRRLIEYVSEQIVPKLDEALKNNGINLNQRQYDSLVSVCYNVGTENFLRSKAFRALANKDIPAFVYELSDPEAGFTKVRINGKLVPSTALIARRRKEVQAFL